MPAQATTNTPRRTPHSGAPLTVDAPAGLARVGTPAQAPGHFCVERNVATLGFFTAAHARLRSGQPKTATVARLDEGSRRFVTVTIVPSASYGLPVTADQDKYFAFLFLLSPLLRNGTPLENPFQVWPAELLQVLGLCTNSGKHYREIREWLDVMTMTTIVSDESVYLANRRSYVRDRFRVFDRAVSAGERLDDGSIAETHYVWLSAWQLDNLRHNHAVTIDLQRYRELTRPIARSLVPLLPLWLRAARERGTFVKRYSDICGLLGLRRYVHPSKIRERFTPALDELEAAAYIGGWSLELNAEGDDFNIALDVPPTTAPTRRPQPVARIAEPHPLVEALVARGIATAAAARLVSRLAPGQDTAGQIASFDRLMASPSSRSIRNPAGLLYRAIQFNEPLGDVTSAVRLVANASPAGERLNRYELLQSYSRYVDAQVAAHVAALSNEELGALLDHHLSELLTEDHLARRFTPQQQRVAARLRLDKHLAKTLPIQRLCDFAKQYEEQDAQQEEATS